ncbi:MAG: transposase [Paracoccus hibiscisoli]|uniref:transposase n=1 Tax=Paracoccus hibiscisoli TaxID=2023261 RepID=UPI00391D505B
MAGQDFAATEIALVGDLCRRHGVSDAAVYKWQRKYGGVPPPGPPSLTKTFRCPAPSTSGR